ncbi:MAG TPA: hypothetical protein VNV44_13905 [Solirubrobacteraceae bacterium]|nr:hypothetical protein [Solirubrobacteraceae bacterium]
MSEQQGDPTAAQEVPSEEELRAAYEAELARITATDMIAQSAVSLLNIGARRMGPPPGATSAEDEPGAGTPIERDLEQVRDSIDAAMALMAILERRIPADQLAPLRDALSRLQMAYAAEVRAAPGEEGDGEGGGGEPAGGSGTPEPGAGEAPAGDHGSQRRPGPAESSGRLWVPGS